MANFACLLSYVDLKHFVVTLNHVEMKLSRGLRELTRAGRLRRIGGYGVKYIKIHDIF